MFKEKTTETELDTFLNTLFESKAPKHMLFLRAVDLTEPVVIGPFHFFKVSNDNRLHCGNVFTLGDNLFDVISSLDLSNFIIPSHSQYCCASCLDDENSKDKDWALEISLLLIGLNDTVRIGSIDWPLNHLERYDRTRRIGSILPMDRSVAEQVEELYNRVVYVSRWKERIIQSFFESVCADNLAFKFVALIMTLEGILEGTAELKYRVSRNVAVLIGKNEEGSRKIFETVKKMYDKRSKYIHGSDVTITVDEYVELYCIVRRVIIKLLYTDLGQKELNNLLSEKGFGSNPINAPDYELTDVSIRRKHASHSPDF